MVKFKLKIKFKTKIYQVCEKITIIIYAIKRGRINIYQSRGEEKVLERKKIRIFFRSHVRYRANLSK